MSFLEHLDELRTRLTVSAFALLGGFLVAFAFSKYVVDFIMRPLQETLPPGGRLVYTEPAEFFLLYLKIAALAGAVLAAPIVMWQLWLFIAPGLYANEKRYAIPFVLLSSIFFVGGAAFSHYMVFPFAWRFFVGFGSDYVEFLPRVAPAFSLYAKMALAMGVVFQMPTLVLFLARMGVLTARFMIRNIKYAVLGIIIISAVITPDGGGVSLVAMAGPMMLLYAFSIGLAWMFGKKKRTAEA